MHNFNNESQYLLEYGSSRFMDKTPRYDGKIRTNSVDFLEGNIMCVPCSFVVCGQSAIAEHMPLAGAWLPFECRCHQTLFEHRIKWATLREPPTNLPT